MTTLEMYKQMHAEGHFPGHSTEKNSDAIKSLIDRYKAETILDFGSGKGEQYTVLKLHEKWGVPMPKRYDPAVPGLDKMPGAFDLFDGVICCDVLEHLEGHELREAIFHASLRATKFCFFSVNVKPAKKLLPDGRNAHLTIQTPEWWTGHIMACQFHNSPAEISVRFDV